MRILLISAHALFGIFMVLVGTAYLFGRGFRDYGVAYTLLILIGIASLVGAVGLGRSRRWSFFVSPLSVLALALVLFIGSAFADGFGAGPLVLFSLIFLILFAVDAMLMRRLSHRERTSPSVYP